MGRAYAELGWMQVVMIACISGSRYRNVRLEVGIGWYRSCSRRDTISRDEVDLPPPPAPPSPVVVSFLFTLQTPRSPHLMKGGQGFPSRHRQVAVRYLCWPAPSPARRPIR